MSVSSERTISHTFFLPEGSCNHANNIVLDNPPVSADYISIIKKCVVSKNSVM